MGNVFLPSWVFEYEDGYVLISNKELMGRFAAAAGTILTADIIGREYRKGAVIYTASPVH